MVTGGMYLVWEQEASKPLLEPRHIQRYWVVESSVLRRIPWVQELRVVPQSPSVARRMGVGVGVGTVIDGGGVSTTGTDGTFQYLVRQISAPRWRP